MLLIHLKGTLEGPTVLPNCSSCRVRFFYLDFTVLTSDQGDQLIDLPGVGNNLRETFSPIQCLILFKHILQRFALNIWTGNSV
jgi:hypothetical protein